MVRPRPILKVYPHDDEVFAACAETVVAHGVASITDLEARLRAVYPEASVHARELAGERWAIWYVYREGRWVRSGAAAPASRDRPAYPDVGSEDLEPGRIVDEGVLITSADLPGRPRSV